MVIACVAISPLLVNLVSGAGLGALDIRVHPGERGLHPPVQLLVEDPSGSKCGLDPRTGESFEQIPGGTYESESIDDDESGAEGPETRILYLGRSAIGDYRLIVTGVASGSYLLEVRNFREDGGPEQAYRAQGSIRTGEVHEFLIAVSQAGFHVSRVSEHGSGEP